MDNEIIPGDLLEKAGKRHLVIDVNKESNTATVEVFTIYGNGDTSTVSIDELYSMKFLKNIMEV